MSFLMNWLSGALQWLFNLIDKLPLHIYTLVTEGAAKIINAIPVPSFVASADSYIAALPPAVAYFSAGLQIPYGIGAIMSAYLLRFIIRRIPFIN